MKRTIVDFLCLIIAFAIQHCIFPFIPFLSAAPNLVLILVFSYAFIYGSKDGMFYGLVAGIFLDLFYSYSFGFFTLAFIWIGYVNGLLNAYYYEEYIIFPITLCVFNEVFYNIYIYFFRFFVRGKTDILFYIKDIILPEMIITLLMTLLIYRLFLIYNRKLEVLDEKRSINVI